MKRWILLILVLLFSCSEKNYFSTTFFSQKSKQLSSAKSQKIMISSQGEESTKIALEIARQGGNIVDVFVALSFAISVERPQSTGLGGGGFALIKLKDKKIEAYDFREVAPLAATEKMFQDELGHVISEKSINGIHAVAVPGLVRGLYQIHQKHGSLAWRDLVLPAANLARRGFVVYSHLAEAIKQKSKIMGLFPSSKKIFFNTDGKPFQEGDLLVQKDLSETLVQIAMTGDKIFYEGEIANKIVNSSKKYGGLLSQNDFKKYKMKERDVVSKRIFGKEIVSMPPPSSGGIHVLQILSLLEKNSEIKWKKQSAHYYHHLINAMSFAFHDRAIYLGDPDFVNVPVEKLLSDRHFETLKTFLKNQYKTSQAIPKESNDTTHFSIMDSEGNAVSSTQTINGYLGSGLVAEGTGIVLNNEMDDFSAKVNASNMFGAIGSEANKISPGKRPLSSMSPTIVFDGTKPILALGTPNGTRIITCVAQVLLNIFAYKMDLESAVKAPRLHHQWKPKEVFVEKDLFTDKVLKQLKKKGHVIKEGGIGCSVQAVMLSTDGLLGVSDPRSEGMSAGF